MMKFIFGMHKKMEVFFNLKLSFRVCVTRHTQIIQNKEYEVDFLPADKHKIFLQDDSITLGVRVCV